MTNPERIHRTHKHRHELLYAHLQELVNDFLAATDMNPSEVPITALMMWACHEKEDPTEDGSILHHREAFRTYGLIDRKDAV